MILGEAKDQRPIFSEYLEEASKNIAGTEKQPVALYLHIHFEDGTFSREHRIHHGFDLVKAIGAFEVEKASLTSQILNGDGLF